MERTEIVNSDFCLRPSLINLVPCDRMVQWAEPSGRAEWIINFDLGRYTHIHR